MRQSILIKQASQYRRHAVAKAVAKFLGGLLLVILALAFFNLIRPALEGVPMTRENLPLMLITVPGFIVLIWGMWVMGTAGDDL